MPVFLPIVPNWQNGVRDTYEFKTDVFVTRNGSEQRRAQRIQPRRRIEAAVLLDGDRLRNFSDALNRARNGKVEIADFSADSAVVVNTVPDGGTVLPVDHVPAWLSNSLTCVLQTGRTARKVTVDFVSDNMVVLTTGVVGSVGHGAVLLPLIAASLPTSNTLSLHTTLVSTSALTFDVEPGSITREPDPLPIDGGPNAETTQFFGPAAIFYGRYVLLRKPNYVQQPKMAFNIAYETVDYGRGVTKTFKPVPIISRTLTASYLATTHADAMALLDIFVRAKGRAGEIYVPTWGQDFPKVKSVSGHNIRVAGTGFFDAYGSDASHRAMLIRTKSGNLIPHEITGLSIDAGDTLIATTDTIGASAAQIESICWMFVARFAQDALTIQWTTNGVASLSLSFVTLANLAAEQSFGNNWILATGQWRDRGQWQDGSMWTD